MCSPVPFSLYINELALEIINDGKQGVTFSSFFVELFVLLFADDVILLSETVIGLQTQLNKIGNAALLLNLILRSMRINAI